MSVTVDAPLVRPQGRPRDPKVDQAILQATLELVAEGGYGSLTMEAVAAAAGVGKATLYRRYAGKEQLVIDAVASMTDPYDPPEGASVAEQLVALLEVTRSKGTSTLAGKLFPRLISARAEHPELMASYREQVIEPRRARFAAVLRRGVESGLIRADVDLNYATDLLIGPLAYRNLIRIDATPDPDLPARVVRDVLAALAPQTCSCSPEKNEDA